MTLRFQEQIPQIVAGFDWSRFSTIVDVGGGQGALLAAILTAHPRMHGHLVDLAPTATDASHTFSAHNLDDRTKVSARSIFDPLPAGADAYLLSDILHNWDDEHAHRILARCVKAAHPTGRVLVIEPVGGRRAITEMDLSMLVISNRRAPIRSPSGYLTRALGDRAKYGGRTRAERATGAGPSTAARTRRARCRRRCPTEMLPRHPSGRTPRHPSARCPSQSLAAAPDAWPAAGRGRWRRSQCRVTAAYWRLRGCPGTARTVWLPHGPR
jgi:O-methyltransferase domain